MHKLSEAQIPVPIILIRSAFSICIGNCFSTKSLAIVGWKFMHFRCLQDGIFVVHESPLICPLLKITPKASSSADTPTVPNDKNTSEAQTSSGSGLALGKKFHKLLKSFCTSNFSFNRLRVPYWRRHHGICRPLSRDPKSRATWNHPKLNQVPIRFVERSIFTGESSAEVNCVT